VKFKGEKERKKNSERLCRETKRLRDTERQTQRREDPETQRDTQKQTRGYIG
jgi:hypothetical protein